LRALRPHRIATSGVPRCASAVIACAVTASQPLSWCEFDRRGVTVSERFSSSTPCFDQGPRSPLPGVGRPRSAEYSRKMLIRLSGSGRTSGATEKLRPTAWPGVG
jgi:hypothetical protein